MIEVRQNVVLTKYARTAARLREGLVKGEGSVGDMLPAVLGFCREMMKGIRAEILMQRLARPDLPPKTVTVRPRLLDGAGVPA